MTVKPQDKLLIAIPSKGRAAQVQKWTLQYVPLLGYDYRIFVEDYDYHYYRRAGLEANQLALVPYKDMGLHYAKIAIRDYALENGYTHVFKIDDDIKYWQYGHGPRSLETSVKTLQETIPNVLAYMSVSPLVGAVGFNYLQFMFGTARKPLKLWQRLQGCYITYPRWLPGIPGASEFEDFSTTLYIWQNGYTTARYDTVGFDADFNAAKGGLKLLDRDAMSAQTLARFAQYCPELTFRNVDKTWLKEPDMVAYARKLKTRYGG